MKGQTTEPTVNSLEVMQRAEDLLYRFQDLSAEVTLKTTQADGREHIHRSRWFWKNFERRDGIDSKAIFYTTFPPAVRGETFLIWDYSKPGKPDDLWLYQPDQRQTRRLTTRDRHESFHGTDLTFEDLGQRQLDLEHHRVLREETCERVPCYVIESVPMEADSPYSRRLSWVAKDRWTVFKIEFFDRQASLLKTQTVLWKKQDDLWLWTGTRVVNHQTGSRTILDVTDLVFNSGLIDQRFELRALSRPP